MTRGYLSGLTGIELAVALMSRARYDLLHIRVANQVSTDDRGTCTKPPEPPALPQYSHRREIERRLRQLARNAAKKATHAGGEVHVDGAKVGNILGTVKIAP